jgi:hypothetical protein
MFGRRRGERISQDEAFHKQQERLTFRSRRDPDAEWRCCEFWPRTLFNKWNSREFAIKQGGRVPKLYWFGLTDNEPPLASLPSHFVIRPVFGWNSHGVLVIAAGRELIRNRAAPLSELKDMLPRSLEGRASVPILIEEFVRAEDGSYRLPLEYKCHTFGDTVGAVEVIDRSGGLNSGKNRYYTPAWQPFSQRMHSMRMDETVRDRPACLAAMLELAMKIGAAIGTYARLDFFASDEGCVFNEFTELPFLGRNFTPFCDDFFGRLWAEKCANAV